MNSSLYSPQRGAALIMALLVVTLATALAAAALERTDLLIATTRGGRDYAQALLLARGAVDYTRAVLAQDARSSSVDHLGEAWATPVPATPAEGGEVGGQIEDLQGRWNLNNLAPEGKIDSEGLSQCRRLLAHLGLPAQLADNLAHAVGTEARPVADQLAPVVSATSPINPFAALGVGFGVPFAAPPPPPSAAGVAPPRGAPFTDLGNLVQIMGFDAATVARLRPYVTVLPGRQRVNVNTAPAPVLAALVSGLSLADAQTLVLGRDRAWFRDATDFRSRLDPKLAAAVPEVEVSSRFFLVHVSARYGVAGVRLHALLDRRRMDAWPELEWQTLQ